MMTEKNVSELKLSKSENLWKGMCTEGATTLS